MRYRDLEGKVDAFPHSGPSVALKNQTGTPRHREVTLNRARKRRTRNPQLEHVSERVNEQLQKQAVSTKSLAEKLDVSEGSLNRILSGHRAWNLQMLLEAASALDVHVDALEPQALQRLRDQIEQLSLQDTQLPALYVFVQKFPKIRAAEDLDALTHIVSSFALRSQAMPEVVAPEGEAPAQLSA